MACGFLNKRDFEEGLGQNQDDEFSLRKGRNISVPDISYCIFESKA